MSDDLDWQKIADADLDVPHRDCCAAKDKRIAELESDLARAVLKNQEMRDMIKDSGVMPDSAPAEQSVSREDRALQTKDGEIR